MSANKKSPAVAAAVRGLAELNGFVMVRRGLFVPLLSPRGDWRSRDWSRLDFDRSVVARGVRVFVRPVTPADIAVLPPGEVFTCRHLLVEGLAPGVRVCREVALDLVPNN